MRFCGERGAGHLFEPVTFILFELSVNCPLPSKAKDFMLATRNLTKTFPNNAVLRNLSLELHPGRVVGLIGPSGGGKSLLLKILAGIMPPTQGEVVFPERDTADTADDASSFISLMFQEGALFDSQTVFDNVAFPLVRGRVPTANLSKEERGRIRERVRFLLSRVGLLAASEKYPAQLSGGMRRRLSLARALATEPSYLLLDDPTCGLDPVASSVIMELIGESYQANHPGVLMVSHDLRRLLPAVEEVWCLFGGKLVFIGPVRELSTQAPEEVLRFVSCRYDFGS